jgi:7-carboxy-7-deazaguanine synthase
MSARARAELPAAERLRITEIFHSLQGEAATVGHPTVFVRLTGCPLRCHYCDTEYAFYGGDWRTIDEVLSEVSRYGTRFVCVTGGEPLAQPNCAPFLARLCEAGYRVSLETSGAMDIGGLDPRVVRVMDWKTPGSGESSRNLLANVAALTAQDQVKLVICDRADYEWAKQALAEHGFAERCEVLFSPSHGQLDARELAEWILSDRLPVRFQIQLHKYLWGDERGR